MTKNRLEEGMHDRITEAYLGGMGESFMHATRKRIDWICAQVRGERVLDIGCRQGIVSILAARASRFVTGIDIDEVAIVQARTYLAGEPEEVQERVQFLHGDVAELSVEGPYDMVILGKILEHLILLSHKAENGIRSLPEGDILRIHVGG